VPVKATMTLEDVNIEEREIQVELETSFLEYAMSVIVSRALPDARDGLKPVHRRILWAAHEMSLRPDRPRVKCGRLVGEVMGKYHPHGDVAIYDALVRMGQDFSLRHPLIDKQGNFGSPSDRPAAMRYTECRLSALAMQMLDGIEEDTVDLVANYSGEFEEPRVLPARFPNLLVNGGQGIAVGMATNIPPHNLGEVVAAVLHLIEHPTATSDDLARFVKGPDFPTGGVIVGRDGILDAYRTGRGSIKLRAVARIEPGRRGDRIVVTEMPYQVSTDAVAEKINDIVEAGGLPGVRDIVDESAQGETRFVVEVRPGVRGDQVLAQLFKQTTLETTFSMNCVALVDGIPRTLTLRDALVAYVEHQYEVVRRRSDFRLRKRRDRAHRVEGLLKALDVLDAIITLIRASEDRADARAKLMAEPYEFSEVQANYILDMQLGQLTRLARVDLESEIAELRTAIGELEQILEEPAVLRRVVKGELQAVTKEFANARRTVIIEGDEAVASAVDLATLVVDAPREIRLTRTGFLSAVDPGAFPVTAKKRAKAVSRNYPDGPALAVLSTNESADLLVITDLGSVHRVEARLAPLQDKPAKGDPLGSLVDGLATGEVPVAVFEVTDDGDGDGGSGVGAGSTVDERLLVVATRRGGIKRVRFDEVVALSRSATVVGLDEGDRVVGAFLTRPEGDVLAMATKGAKVIRFEADEVRPMGRAAGTIAGMRLQADDEVIWVGLAPETAECVAVSDVGFAKRTSWSEYPVQGRGGQGVRGFRAGGKSGERVTAWASITSDADEVWLGAAKGQTIIGTASDIAPAARDHGGTKLAATPAGGPVTAIVVRSAAVDAPPEPAAEVAPEPPAVPPVPTAPAPDPEPTAGNSLF
jgi:DNA gyrase subunit A